MVTRKPRLQAVKPAQPEVEQIEQPVPNPGVLHNDHDVDALMRETAKTIAYMAQRGVDININTIDVNNLRTKAETFALCRLLIAKGLFTEAELQAEVYGAILGMLHAILQHVEEQRLAEAPARPGQKIAVARSPLPIQIARH